MGSPFSPTQELLPFARALPISYGNYPFKRGLYPLPFFITEREIQQVEKVRRVIAQLKLRGPSPLK
jgi:hypothetical protein